MPRYFFHVRGGSHPAEDLLGTEFPDNHAARAHAEQIASRMAAEKTVEGRPATDDRIEVEDEEGRSVFMLPHFSEGNPDL